MPTKVVFLRKWHKPKVEVTIDSSKEGGMQIEIPMEDFREGLRQEMGWVAQVFSTWFDNAFNATLDGMRSATKYAMIQTPKPKLPTYDFSGLPIMAVPVKEQEEIIIEDGWVRVGDNGGRMEHTEIHIKEEER